jgi:hypothetical protein
MLTNSNNDNHSNNSKYGNHSNSSNHGNNSPVITVTKQSTETRMYIDSNTVKYGHESCRTRNQEWLYWRGQQRFTRPNQNTEIYTLFNWQDY